jgi:RNA polymerase sigma-70 factor (ECF subfamily)
MTDDSLSTDLVRSLLERLEAGDDRAGSELINQTAARVGVLTRRMFRDFDRLGRWEEADDVCQNASVRLWRALRDARPKTPIDYYRLAALQIRRELIDQVRRHFGPEGIGANHESNAAPEGSTGALAQSFEHPQSTLDPAKLSRWTEFHERVAVLPEEERSVFDLIWYQGLPQAEAAELLGVSERTLKRRWLAARLSIGRALDGAPPG